ncbi:MAG: hypothetical protein IPL61_29085 [Myxococcales bacterium]|nr:hypothetical protein [Myxococcales bacterium]
MALVTPRGRAPVRARGDGPERAARDGVTSPGSAVARATILPTLAALGERGDLDIAGALARLPTDLERARRRLRKHGDADAQVALAEVELSSLDGRLHERVAAAPPTVAGPATVARGLHARAPFRPRPTGHAPAFDRAAEVEDLLVSWRDGQRSPRPCRLAASGRRASAAWRRWSCGAERRGRRDRSRGAATLRRRRSPGPTIWLPRPVVRGRNAWVPPR